MKNSEENSACFANLQAGFSHELHSFPVPVAAELLRMRFISPVLPPTQPFPIAPPMFQQKNFSIGSANSRHFP
ncbi:MAG: hypothetical protein ACREP8_14255, partial [Candidatus Binatia bacterium]